MWVVGVSKPQRELWGKENIERQGYETYLPRFMEPVSRRGKISTKITCLFPRYIFVRVDGPWHFLMSTYGMTGVVLAGQQPAVVPEAEIEALKAREHSGLVELPPPAPVGPQFKSGDKAKITQGSFTGVEGVVQGMKSHDRVSLLLDFLGEKRPVLVERAQLAASPVLH